MKKINKWKKFMAVGCSHGNHADPEALQKVLDFKKEFKPDQVIHLGDFTDMSAFMGSANGNGEPVAPDLDGGIEFLKRLEPTVVLCGNHEARLWRDRLSHNALRVQAAESVIDEIEKCCFELRAKLIPYDGVWQVHKLGNFTFTHGTIYNENSCRDMAETYGNVIFAHTHKVSQQYGRRIDNPIGISVGTLTRKGAMEYANTRRSTLAWSQGLVYGEYIDTDLKPTIKFL